MRAWVILGCLMGQPGLAECLDLGAFVLPFEGEVLVQEVTGAVVIDFTPGGRAASEVMLVEVRGNPTEKDVADLLAGFPQRFTTRAGLTLAYETMVGEAVGSGGAEDVGLTGVLDSTPPLMVSCRTQAEYPNPEWCLPMIDALRPKAEGCGE
ncbi:MAG: hypothetical protein ACRC6I_17335 [Paracoccaceae bacterium]